MSTKLEIALIWLEKAAAIISYAETRLGDPYSQSKRGTGKYVDCSYFTYWCYKQVGISLPTVSVNQAQYCYDNGFMVGKNEIEPGDLIFWTDNSCSCGRWTTRNSASRARAQGLRRFRKGRWTRRPSHTARWK